MFLLKKSVFVLLYKKEIRLNFLKNWKKNESHHPTFLTISKIDRPFKKSRQGRIWKAKKQEFPVKKIIWDSFNWSGFHKKDSPLVR